MCSKGNAMIAAQSIRNHVRKMAKEGLHVFTLHDFIARGDHPRLVSEDISLPDCEMSYEERYRLAFNSAMYYFRKFLRTSSPRSERQKDAVFWTPVRIADNVYSYRGYLEAVGELNDRERFLILVRIAAYLSRGMFAAICMESALYYQNIAPYKDMPVTGLQVLRDAHELKKETPFGLLVFSRFNCSREKEVRGRLLHYPELELPVCSYELSMRQINKRQANRTNLTQNGRRGEIMML